MSENKNTREWKSLVDKTDKENEDTLKKSVKASLRDLRRALNGDSTTESTSLFKIHTMSHGAKMDVKPTFDQVKELLRQVRRRGGFLA